MREAMLLGSVKYTSTFASLLLLLPLPDGLILDIEPWHPVGRRQLTAWEYWEPYSQDGVF